MGNDMRWYGEMVGNAEERMRRALLDAICFDTDIPVETIQRLQGIYRGYIREGAMDEYDRWQARATALRDRGLTRQAEQLDKIVAYWRKAWEG